VVPLKAGLFVEKRWNNLDTMPQKHKYPIVCLTGFFDAAGTAFYAMMELLDNKGIETIRKTAFRADLSRWQHQFKFLMCVIAYFNKDR
jgi:hypothetical protein